MPIQLKENLWDEALMLDKKAWLAVDVLIPPKGVQWC